MAALERQNEQLQTQLQREQQDRQLCLERMKFFLIRTGLPSRITAQGLTEAFRVEANHTAILKQTAEYGRKATSIMKEYFWPQARDVDLDEIFIEGLPLFLAAEPKSMALLKASQETERTEARWSAFLDELRNLERTTGDRGKAILAAIARREKLIHQSDIFHPKKLLRTELGKMEKQCYKLIAAEYKAEGSVQKAKAQGKKARGPAQRYCQARQKARKALELFDELEQAVAVAFQALRLTIGGTQLNSAKDARESLELAHAWIEEHLPQRWANVKSALQDEALLTFLEELEIGLELLPVQLTTPQDREYVLATLAKLWEDQAHARYRGKPVHIPPAVQQELSTRCTNLAEVTDLLFETLDSLHRASSAIECINSRIGFHRYSKRRFSTDYANLFALSHNLTPFHDGKRKGRCPAKILGVELPTYDLYELLGVGQN